jgi:hypothetical protein
LLTLSAYAGEMDRIESIVVDIENLREDYNRCMKELDIQNAGQVLSKKTPNAKLKKELREKDKLIRKYKTSFEIAQTENLVLLSKLDSLGKKANITDLSDNSQSKEYKRVLLIKENEIKNLKRDYYSKLREKEKIILSLENKIKSMNKSTFPELLMKDEKVEKTQKPEKEVVETFKAAVFKLKDDSDIYNKINGDVVERWERDDTFTSGVMSQNWMKITGYFVHRKWQPTTQEWWIKKSDIVKK